MAEPKKKPWARSTRMPTSRDMDEFGMCRIQITDRQGRKQIRRVPSVDAREIILSDSGTLDIETEVATVEAEKDHNMALFEEMSLDQLRALAVENQLSYVGKPKSALRAMLMEHGVKPRVKGDDE